LLSPAPPMLPHDPCFPLFPPHASPSRLPFFFTLTASPAIYTLSLHDALPILYTMIRKCRELEIPLTRSFLSRCGQNIAFFPGVRSEEHTSELQSRFDLVCRLLLEKKKRKGITLCT